MFLCDCHCDTLSKSYNQDKNLFKNDCQLDIARIIANGGGLQFFAIWIPEDKRKKDCVKYTLQVMDKYNNELEELKRVGVDFTKIERIADIKKLNDTGIGMLLAIEGGEAIAGSLEILRMYYRLGVRCMTITWNYKNELAYGVKESALVGGLTQIGRQVIGEMNRLGMLIDVSHISEVGFWDIIELSKKPVIATHSNAKALCDIPRNLSDEQIKAVAEKNGVIGVNIYPYFLEKDFKKANIDSIYRHIEHIISICGEEHVGIGTDFDGIEVMPQGIIGVESMNYVFDYLSEKNYSLNTIAKIAYENVKRVLMDVL